jgi:lysophospholipase L1-like esterase
VTKEEVTEKANDTSNTVAKMGSELATERARIDNLVSGATADDAEVVDIRVGADGVTYDSAGGAVRTQHRVLSERIFALDDKASSPNKFNEKSDKNTKGAYLFYNGKEAVVGSDYSYSYPISVVAGETYISKRFDYSLGTDSHYIIAYDANMKYHSFIVCEKVVSNGVDCNLFTTPAGVHFVRVNYMAGRDFMFVHGNEYPAEFVEYYDGRTDHDVLLNVKHPFSSKVMVNFGDSIFGLVQAPNDISTYLKNIIGGTIHNVGFGGCRMGRHTNANYDAFSMYRLAEAIASNDWTVQKIALEDTSLPEYFAKNVDILKSIDFNSVDIVTIAYGTNDFADGLQPGEFVKEGSNKFNYFTTALKYSIETIQKAYPQIRIFVLTPCWRCWVENGEVVADSNTKEVAAWPAPNGNTKLTDFVDACWDVAKTHQIPVIDNYNIGINKFNHAHYLADGTHHNDNGRKLIAAHIAKELF